MTTAPSSPRVRVIRGTSPVILGFPHSSTWLPPPLRARLTPHGQSLIDTDWHVDRLYAGLLPSASEIHAGFHRYVIDANRPPDGESLYPGQATTDLCPVTDFDGQPIWQDGQEPEAQDIEARRKAYHDAYHLALSTEIERVRSDHGIVVLYDCHSIRSQVPRLFEGRLPDLNLGTNDGNSCSSEIKSLVHGACMVASGYTSVVNGRFKGGWTTRHYGAPDSGIHALQMELAQSTHLETEAAPFAYSVAKADRLREVLGDILQRLDTYARKGTRI